MKLRKANRIKTIRSSLAIEGNALSEEEERKQYKEDISQHEGCRMVERMGSNKNGYWVFRYNLEQIQ